ncbi:MAG: hypothetical protein IH984_08105 [Planctomycetes bacterium]|nr:hypothetical protein [Planctomycetota bacterium]
MHYLRYLLSAVTILAGSGLLVISRQLPNATQTKQDDHSPVIAEPFPAPPILGIAINAHHISDLKLYLESVDQIAKIGANSLIVVTPMFQTLVDSNEIRYLPKKCPTAQQLIAILKHAKKRNLHTTLLPIVLIEKPGEKDWRGVIEPTDWDAWWKSYDNFIDRFVKIAVTADVDLFSIGSELNTTESQINRWTRIAKNVRQSFPGKLTYSANWDRYDKIKLWPLVDIMSVSSYFELSRDDEDAPFEILRDAWIKERDLLLKTAKQYDRPLMLSEVGYPSLSSAAAFPWNYVAKDGEQADHAAQARCYEAFFAAWTDVVVDPTNLAIGFHCYHWDPYHHGDSRDTGYGIKGKPALEIIRKGFEDIRRQAADAKQ